MLVRRVVEVAFTVVASTLAAPRASGQASSPPVAPPASAASRASAAYRPAEELRGGRELVAVFISSSGCIGNRVPGFLDAMPRVNARLAAEAAAARRPFAAVGVSTEWSPDSALAYLRRVGPFDEYSLGRNWMNSAVVAHVWRDAAGKPVEPQVVLLERDVDMTNDSRIGVGPDRVIARYLGAGEIMTWEAQRALLAPPPPSASAGAAAGAAVRH